MKSLKIVSLVAITFFVSLFGCVNVYAAEHEFDKKKSKAEQVVEQPAPYKFKEGDAETLVNLMVTIPPIANLIADYVEPGFMFKLVGTVVVGRNGNSLRPNSAWLNKDKALIMSKLYNKEWEEWRIAGYRADSNNLLDERSFEKQEKIDEATNHIEKLIVRNFNVAGLGLVLVGEDREIRCKLFRKQPCKESFLKSILMTYSEQQKQESRDEQIPTILSVATHRLEQDQRCYDAMRAWGVNSWR